MFYHAYKGYMQHAFPMDDLAPITCKGKNPFGGIALTLIDALDTLVVLGDRAEFANAVHWLTANLTFDRDVRVYVCVGA